MSAPPPSFDRVDDATSDCFHKYQNIVQYYIKNPTHVVSQEHIEEMKNCGYKNFENEVEQIRKIKIGRSKYYGGGRKSRKRRSDKIKKRKRRTHTR